MQKPYPLVCDRGDTVTIDGTTGLLGELAPVSLGQAGVSAPGQATHPGRKVHLIHLTLLHLTDFLSTGLFRAPIKSCTSELIFQSKDPCESPLQYTCINYYASGQ